MYLMAKINYSDVSSVMSRDVNSNNVGFFSLKDNGDEAIVRIMHDSTDTFDIVSTHNVTMEGYKYGRKVSCIRDVHDPVDACPFCQAGKPIQTRMFIHLIEYSRDDQGKIIGEPKIWERSMQYAKEIANLISDYGPLSNCLFKVRRNGSAGDMKTTYSINYAPPSVYNPEFYPVDNNAFEGYSVLGTLVLGKSADDMKEYLTTGSFPERNAEQSPVAYSEIPTAATPPSYNFNSPVAPSPSFNSAPATCSYPNASGVNTPPWVAAQQSTPGNRYY